MQVAKEFASVVEAAEYYASIGWQPIAGRFKGKIPANKDWQTTPWKEKEELARFERGQEYNIGLLLGKSCVDVDLDTVNARRYAKHFLPPTLCLQKEGNITHYLYTVPVSHDPVPTKQFNLPSNKMSCEMRGTDGSGSPQYTVVAPSTHPSGASIELVGDTPATISSGDWLYRQVRLIAFCDLLTPYYSEGMRNNLTLGIAGFLLKNGYDEDTVHTVMDAIREITGDTDDAKCRSRIQSTVRKLEVGGRVAGEQTLKNLLPKEVMDCLSRWFHDMVTRLEDYQIDEIESLPVEERLPYLTYVIDADVFTTDGSHWKPAQIPHIFGRVAPAKELRAKMQSSNKVRGFGYFPNKELIVRSGVEYYWNNWRPTHLEPIEGDVTRFLNHVSSLCDGEEESIRALLGFASHAIKKPEQKVRWMPILIGGQGSYKTTFCEILGELVGKANYSAIAAKEMLGNFTGLIENKLVVVIEEMRISHGSQAKALANALKEKITNDRVTINRKYVQEYQIENVARFIGLSNYTIPVEMEATDRRYFPIISRTATKHSGVTVKDAVAGWGQGYHNWLYFEKGLEAIYHYLLNYDTNMFDANAAPKQSARQQELKRIIQETTTAPERAEEIYEAVCVLGETRTMCDIAHIRRYLQDREGINNVTAQMINAALDHYGLRRFSLTSNKSGASKRYNICLLRGDEQLQALSDRELLAVYLNDVKQDDDPQF